jgi:hypothetical protein
MMSEVRRADIATNNNPALAPAWMARRGSHATEPESAAIASMASRSAAAPKAERPPGVLKGVFPR